MATYLSGKASVALYYKGGDSVTIEPQYIGEDGVTVTMTPGTRTITTQAGTTTTPSGTIDEAMFSFPLVLPSMNYLGTVLPGTYEPSVDRPTVAGQTTIGGNDCGEVEAKAVIHFICDDNSDNDIYIPVALISPDLSTTINTTDGVVVTVMGYAQPSDELNGGVARYGTGDLTEPTLFNPATGTYAPLD